MNNRLFSRSQQRSWKKLRSAKSLRPIRWSLEPLEPRIAPVADLPAAISPGGTWIWTNQAGDLSSTYGIDSSTEIDVFAFMPDVDGTYTISTDGSLDTMLGIYDNTGELIHGPVDNTFHGELTSGPLTAGSWYYFAVGAYQSSTGSYTLSINGPSLPTGSVATPAPSYSGSVTDAIHYGGDLDYFSITAPTGATTLNLSVAPASGLDTYVELYNNAGTRITHFDNGGTGGVDTAGSISVTSGATYYVGVSSYSPTHTGNYTLTVDFNPDQTIIDDNYENNDTKAITDGRTAGATNSPNLGLLTTQRVISSLKMADGVDWYRFQMNGTGTSSDFVQIDFTHSQGDLDMALYRSDGVQLVASSAGTSNSEYISLNGQPSGTYYVKVYGYNGAQNPNYTLTVDPGTAVVDDAYEDNDTKAITDGRSAGAANSANLGSLTAPRTIANLRMADGTDWYRFQMAGIGTSADYVQIDFTHSQGDLDMVLYRADGSTVVGSSAGTGNTERVSLNGQAAGTYYVKVYGYHGADNPNYSLTIDPAPAATDDAYEDNDSAAITSGRPEAGTNSPNFGLLTSERTIANLKMLDSADWYEFTIGSTGTSADSVRIDFSHSQGDLDLVVYRADGATVVGSSASINNSESVSLNGLAVGTYYVKVYGYNGAQNPNYSLTIDPPVVISDDAYEDNDTKVITDSRPEGGTDSPNLGQLTTQKVISGLQMNDAADWYKFQMSGAGTSADFVRIDFTHSQGDLDLVVYKADGSTAVGSSAGTGNREQVSLNGQPAGTYYVRVYGYNGVQNPNYSLTVDPAVASVTDDAYEENDTKAAVDGATAGAANSPNLGALTNEHVVSGLKMGDGADWYRFQMSGTGTSSDFARIDFTHSQGDLDMVVYGADGSTLIGSSAGTGNSEQVSLNGQPAGTYYVKVYGYNSAHNPSYSLTIDPGAPASGDDVYEDNDTRVATDGRQAGAADSPNLGTLASQLVINNLQMSDSADWYRFQMNGSGTTNDYVQIDFTHSLGDLDMAVYSGDGTTLVGSSTSANNVEQVSLNGQPAGTYYVKVYGYNGAHNPNYNLTVDPGTEAASGAQNYVVLFAGGFDASNNHSRYYNNIKALYTKIVGFGCVPRDNIYVLFADGTNPAADQNTGSGSPINSNMTFANGSTVMAATSGNLQSVLTTLGTRVDSDDNFLFYSFDHGGGTFNAVNDMNEDLTGWGNSIDDSVLVGWLRGIHSGHSTYVFTECFSGGMLDDFGQMRANEYGMAATNHYEYSWGDGFAKAFLNSLTATGTGSAVFGATKLADPFSARGTYPNNGGTIVDEIEHPWATGSTFPIFNTGANTLTLQSQDVALYTPADLVAPNSLAPSVTTLTSLPASPVVVGNVVTLAATVTGDSISNVKFYEDLDQDNVAEAGEELGTDLDGSDGWSVQWDTKLHGTGQFTLLAVAENTAKDVSTPRSLVMTLDAPAVNHAPTVATFVLAPDSPIVVGELVTLTATATDPDAGDHVDAIRFYEDLNSNGSADPGELLGVDPDGSDGWSYSWDTKLHAVGAVTLLAVAEDVQKLASTPHMLAMTFEAAPVNHAPGIDSFTSDLASPIEVGTSVILTVIAEDADGAQGDHVARVRFYEDLDGEGDADANELLGSDLDGSDGWSFLWETKNHATGPVMLLAVAEDTQKEISTSEPLLLALSPVATNHAPSIVSFTSVPGTWFAIGRPATLTIAATDSDENDQVDHVFFFEDRNRNGIAEFLAPNLELIGRDTDGSDGWSYTWDTTGHAAGSVRLLAVAYDSSNTASAARLLTVTMTAAPTASLVDGVLRIAGSAGSDNLAVEFADATHLQVVDRINGNYTFGPFDATEVHSISVSLGAGDDYLTVDESVTTPLYVLGGAGNDSISGSLGSDSLFGEAGNDTLIGGAGSDVLNGGAGTDRIIERGSGSITLTNTSFNANGSDVLSGIEQASVTGSNGDDTITATTFSGSVTLSGGDGDDVLYGGRSGDWFSGGPGANAIFGNGGIDRIIETSEGEITLGNTGLTSAGTTDVLTSIEQADLTGSASNDHIDASAFTAGSVTLNGAGGNDVLIGSSSADVLTGGAGNDTISGGAGVDRLYETGNVDFALTNSSLTGAPGSDVLENDIESAVLVGGIDGNRFDVSGWTKAITVNGGLGSDVLVDADDRSFTLTNLLLTRSGTTSVSLVSIEQAFLTGGAGNNTLNAHAFTLGSVTLDGGAGNDTLMDGMGGDLLVGGDGNDRLDAAAGDDTMSGGDGNDTFVERVDGSDSIGDTGGDDLLDFTTASHGIRANLSLQGAPQAMDSLGNNLSIAAEIETVSGSNYNDIIVGDENGNVLLGNKGNDTLRGLEGNDTLNGGTGTDCVSEAGSFNFVLSNGNLTGASTDIDTLISIEQARLTGTTRDDTLDAAGFTAGPVMLDGSDGNDLLLGGAGNDSLMGGADSDSLDGANGNDTLDGGTEADSVVGCNGNDLLTGGAGNDSLDGGAGGADRLVESANVDYILTDGELKGVGNDEFSNIEQVSLTGGADANSFEISGWLRGGVTLDGGLGTDRVVSENNANFTLSDKSLVRSGGGMFSLLGIEQASLTGGDGNNSLNASAFAGIVTLIGGDGNDTLVGGKGDDILRGGNGGDKLTGNNGNDVIDGGLDNDSLFGGNGDDYLFGNDGYDNLQGDAGTNTLIDYSGVRSLLAGTASSVVITAKTDPTLAGIMATRFPWVAFP